MSQRVREVFPEIAEKIERTLRDRPPLDDPKRSISIRVARDIIAAFKAKGKGWPSRMNDALRKAAEFRKNFLIGK